MYQASLEHREKANTLDPERVSNLSVSYFVAQWVPATSAKVAETSFFTINDAAAPLDKLRNASSSLATLPPQCLLGQ
jgi:hypothetical protein